VEIPSDGLGFRSVETRGCRRGAFALQIKRLRLASSLRTCGRERQRNQRVIPGRTESLHIVRVIPKEYRARQSCVRPKCREDSRRPILPARPALRQRRSSFTSARRRRGEHFSYMFVEGVSVTSLASAPITRLAQRLTLVATSV